MGVENKVALVRAMKDLLAEDGYLATSPRDVLRRSGVGHGSLYHHFDGKDDLVATALAEVATEMRSEADALLDSVDDPLEGVLAWLRSPRQPLMGCRLGRLTGEPILEQSRVRDPIGAFFEYLQHRLTEKLRDAVAAGDLDRGVASADLAATLVAVVQGGFVLARATGDPDAMNRAQRGALALLSVSRKGA